eukprot:1384669-Amorphochlora_amoeboformis.AAC.1
MFPIGTSHTESAAAYQFLATDEIFKLKSPGKTKTLYIGRAPTLPLRGLETVTWTTPQVSSASSSQPRVVPSESGCCKCDCHKMKRPPSNYQPLSLGLAPGFGGWTFDSLSDNILAPRRDEKIGANYSPIATGVMPPSVGSVPSTVSASATLTSGRENRERESKKRNIEVTESKESEPDGIYYKGHKYIGPTKDNRPQYKAKQEWEWDIYPHGVSKQGDRLRVQIKQKGANPT